MKQFKLKENEMFYTPKDQKEFEDMMSDFNGAESVAAWTAAGWAWNLAAKMVNEKLAMLDKEELQ
jgi:hypothetical protein